MTWELGIEIWEERKTEARLDMRGGIPRRLFCFDLQSIQTGMCSARKRSRQGRGNGPGEALLEESKSMSIYWATSACPILVIFQCIISCYSVRDNQGHVSSVQLLSCVRLFVTPWTAARQASLSITNSRSLLKLMSIELVIPFNHLILCCLLLLPASIFPNIRVFSNESVLHIRVQSIGVSLFQMTTLREIISADSHPAPISFLAPRKTPVPKCLAVRRAV